LGEVIFRCRRMFHWRGAAGRQPWRLVGVGLCLDHRGEDTHMHGILLCGVFDRVCHWSDWLSARERVGLFEELG
jgi:hypothetical protein